MPFQPGEIGYHDPGMAWSSCVSCSRLEGIGSRVDIRNLCQQCQKERLNYLAPRLRDRSYRAHLARRALGINVCDVRSSCPEQPLGHSIFNLSATPADSRAKNPDVKDAYAALIMAISDKLMRRDRRSASALEIIVSNLDVQHRVKFCATCFQNAIQQSQYLPQPQIQLCQACLERRDQHISTVHARQSSFHEAWENDVTQMPVCHHEHDPVQYAYDFDNAIERISGRRWGLKGGMPWSDVGVKIVALAMVSLAAGFTFWGVQVARGMLSETKRKNRNDETIAMQNAQTAIRNSEIARETLEETKRKNAFEAIKHQLIGHDEPVLEDFMRVSAAQLIESSIEIPAYTALRQRFATQAGLLQSTPSHMGNSSTQANPARQDRPALSGDSNDRSLTVEKRGSAYSLVGNFVSATGLQQRIWPSQQRVDDLEQGLAPPNIRFTPTVNNGPGVPVAPVSAGRSPPNQMPPSESRAALPNQSTFRSAMPWDPAIPPRQNSGAQANRQRVRSLPTPSQPQPGAWYPPPERNLDPASARYNNYQQ